MPGWFLSIDEHRQRMADAGTPAPLLVACLFGLGSVFATFLYPLFLVDPPLLAVLFSMPASALSLYCLFRILAMRLRPLLVYVLLFIVNQVVLVIGGIWSGYTLIILAAFGYRR